MRARSLVFLFGALTTSVQSFAATDVPVAPVAGSSDYRFLKMEKEHPGFGGMFSDETGAVNVYMLNPETGAATLSTELRDSQLLSPKKAAAPINILQGQYSFSTLVRWRDRLLPALVFKGTVFLDIDETQNRLFIGVSDPAAIQIVRNKARARGIPQQALIIEKTEPFRVFQTVNDMSRPVIGGCK